MRGLTMFRADGTTAISGPYALGDIIAGVADTPVKVGWRNDADEAPTALAIVPVDVSDGYAQFRIGADTTTLSPPYGVTVSVSAPGAGGAWGATGVYRVVVTAVNATGETVASVEAGCTITAVTQTISVNATAIGGATSYNIYRRTEAGTFATPSKIANHTTLPFTYAGAAPSAGTPPVANTTGGAGPTYGIPPTMGLGPIVFGAPLAFGAWVFAWVSRVVPTGTTPDDNTRVAGIQFTY